MDTEAFGLGGNQGDDEPAAYLNYILFDKNYKLLDMGWQAVTSASSWAQAKVEFSNIAIKEEGYIFVYLSYENESNNYVYFDDLKVTHTKSNVIQYNEYYAFGLQTASSWTREDSKNDFLYNSGSELNNITSNYEMFHRGYDPVLGRMLQVDPYASAFATLTPYNYAGNNPISMNDPSGGYMRSREIMESGEFGGDFNNAVIGQTSYGDFYNQIRDPYWNFGLLKQGDFESFYGVDLSTDAGQWAVAQSMTITPGESDINIIASNLGFHGASVDGNNAWFIVNLVRAVYMGGIEAENQVMMGEYGAINVSLGITRNDLLSAALESRRNSDLLGGMGQFIFDTGATFYGGAERGIQMLRRAHGGPKAVGKFFGVGTQRTAAALRGTLSHVSKIGKMAGTAGFLLQGASIITQISSGDQVSTADAVGFGISTVLVGGGVVLAGTVAAPFIAGAALIYGVAELSSLIITGQSLEENIFGNE